MRSVPLFVFTLGLVWASVVAQTPPEENATVYWTITGIPIAAAPFTQNGDVDIMETLMNITSSTQQNTTGAPVNPESSINVTAKVTTTNVMAKVTTTTKSTTITSTTKRTKGDGALPTAKTSSGPDKTGIIIIVLIIVAATVVGCVCYFTRRNSARYTVDLTTQPDDAQIPLSSVEPQEPVNATTLNGMPTLDSVDVDPKESNNGEKTADPQAPAEQKEEAENPLVDVSAAPPAPAPSPDSGSVEEAEAPAQAPAQAPAELVPEGGPTDDESTVSNETSVESLKEPNENKNNNKRKSAGELQPDRFTDVPLEIAWSEPDNHLSSAAVPQKP